MDDFTKQKINEQKYKKFREQPREEYHGNFESPHYKEVKNQAVGPTEQIEKETFSTEYKKDFDKASRDFWQKETQTGIMKYNAGSLTADFGKDEFTVEEFFERISKFIKESITNELIAKNIPTEGLTENFKAVDVALKLLSASVKKIDDKMNIVDVSAFMQGFINTYVNNVVTKKMERDKRANKNA